MLRKRPILVWFFILYYLVILSLDIAAEDNRKMGASAELRLPLVGRQAVQHWWP
jgi:hypothetical protein